METFSGVLFLSGAYPLWRAWRANRHTSLLQAVNWAVVAWAAWGLVLLAVPLRQAPAGGPISYLALCLTGCAGVAVLGARRPGVGAWNFVVVALLAVMLLPLAESMVVGRSLQTGSRLVLLGCTLAVGVINYLPTRLGPAALFLAAGCAAEALTLATSDTRDGKLMVLTGRVLIALAPWVAFTAMRLRPPPVSEFDRLWLDFRDRFGLFWGQRVREQFNHSAAHAGWPLYLRWRSLKWTAGPSLPEAATQEAPVAVFRALLKRFGSEWLPP
jgi:hypothetical protein